MAESEGKNLPDFRNTGVAECTHYGGPLEKGLVVDGTVRCPWHQSCCSLRTSEALRAPALDPLPQWEVEERGGRFHVTSRKQRDPLKPTAYDQAARKHSPDGIVIIGMGAAGSAAAEMLRRCDCQGLLTMIDGDDGEPYDRPKLSKGFLAGEADSGDVPLRQDGPPSVGTRCCWPPDRSHGSSTFPAATCRTSSRCAPGKTANTY